MRSTVTRLITLEQRVRPADPADPPVSWVLSHNPELSPGYVDAATAAMRGATESMIVARFGPIGVFAFVEVPEEGVARVEAAGQAWTGALDPWGNVRGLTHPNETKE